VEVADMGVSQGKNGANTASSMSVVDIKKLSRSGSLPGFDAGAKLAFSGPANHSFG
jgi:hypothetical protein